MSQEEYDQRLSDAVAAWEQSRALHRQWQEMIDKLHFDAGLVRDQERYHNGDECWTLDGQHFFEDPRDALAK